MRTPVPESLFSNPRLQPLHALFCHRRVLPSQDAWLCGQLGKPAGRERQRPAARGWLCQAGAQDSGACDQPVAYPGSQRPPPSTLASRGEAALYRRASQQQPRYTTHDQQAPAGAGRQAQGPAAPARPWGVVQSHALAPTQQPAGPSLDAPHATVHFCCQFRTEYGQRLRVVGSHANLGSWILADGPEMAWTSGDLWRADVLLPAGGVYEYKYVLVGGGAGGDHALAWQRGNNSVLALSRTETEAEVMDNWEGAPGAVVVVGGRAATREGKLLAWATEMEAIVASQRNELRAVRMELAAMQEELRQARQLRAELERLQDVRKQEAAALSEAQTSNQQLRTQLVEATAAFQHALTIAQTLLNEAEELTGLSDEYGDTEGEWDEAGAEDVFEQGAEDPSLQETSGVADAPAAVESALQSRT